MNNNITLHAPQQLFFLNELFAFQHHPQIIAIFIHPLLLMHYHVYLFDILANRGEKHEVSSSNRGAFERKEMFSLFKSAVIIIRLSAFLAAQKCVHVRAKK
jgi:hypothetical protein